MYAAYLRVSFKRRENSNCTSMSNASDELTPGLCLKKTLTDLINEHHNSLRQIDDLCNFSIENNFKWRKHFKNSFKLYLFVDTKIKCMKFKI